jgi:hypothetical protein
MNFSRSFAEKATAPEFFRELERLCRVATVAN